MEIYEYGKKDAPLVLIQLVDDHDLEAIENEVARIRENSSADFRLIACKVGNWNKDLSPWKTPAVFGKEDFGEGAPETLRQVLSLTEEAGKTYIIGGYSLAGLFALWAACQTDRFRGVAAASPSVWFPGFVNYLKQNKIKAEAVYLSLGDKEERTRNPVMAAVGDRIRETHQLLLEEGIRTTLAWNPGNHFRDADLRTASAFAWVMKELAAQTDYLAMTSTLR
ncbi:MAG: esterase [Eubacterium sp.]|nr:esterase [Eubacterium sp.]